MAQPYDTVSDEEQKEFYEANENNIIRISKGMKFDTDTDTDNCYTRADGYLRDWIERDILKREGKRVIYLYEQRVQRKMTVHVNHGIVSLLELCDITDGSGDVMFCEKPQKEIKQDRYDLISSINANVDMINCMYIDPEKSLWSVINEITDELPDMEFSTYEKVIDDMTIHRIWVIEYDETIHYIQKLLENKTMFVLDGHNRYATALEYRNYCREHDPSYTPDSPCNYIMTFAVNAYGNRTMQLPVHRIIDIEKMITPERFIACAQDHFKVEKIIVDTAIDDFVETFKKQISTVRMENKIGVYFGGNYFYRLTFTDKEYLKLVCPDCSDVYRGLDVVVLNEMILKDILNLHEESFEEYIRYTKSATKGVDQVKKGKARCVFVMNPVKAEQIREIAMSGEIMPDRSIYIFPKPATGAIINKF